MSHIKIAIALSVFQKHLVENLGQPINVSTIAAFSAMLKGIVEAMQEEE